MAGIARAWPERLSPGVTMNADEIGTKEASASLDGIVTAAQHRDRVTCLMRNGARAAAVVLVNQWIRDAAILRLAPPAPLPPPAKTPHPTTGRVARQMLPANSAHKSSDPCGDPTRA